MKNRVFVPKFAIYNNVSEILFSLIEGTDKLIGNNIFGLIHTLPTDLEEKLFTIDPDNQEANIFSIDITNYAEPNSGIFSIEIYVVRGLRSDEVPLSIIAHIIYAVKIFKETGKEWRLYFMLDKNLHVVVYLHLEIRPYDRIESEWFRDITDAYYHYINIERPRYRKNEDLTGKWTWI